MPGHRWRPECSRQILLDIELLADTWDTLFDTEYLGLSTFANELELYHPAEKFSLRSFLRMDIEAGRNPEPMDRN